MGCRASLVLLASACLFAFVQSVSAECLMKAEAKCSTAFAKIEAKGGSVTDGDIDDAKQTVDACLLDVVAQVVPSSCGDGVTDLGEDCDEGGESPDRDLDCTVAECGNGTRNLSAGEACDGTISCGDCPAGQQCMGTPGKCVIGSTRRRAGHPGCPP